MIIRKMEIRDIMDVVGLIQNDLGYDDISSDIYDRVMRIHDDPSHTTFVAEENGRVVGFAGVVRGLAYEFDGEYARLISLAVNRNYRGKGVGSMLEARAEEYAREIGAHSMVISSGLSRKEAHVFYMRKGYQKKGYSFIKPLRPKHKFSYSDVIYTPIPSRPDDDD